jgi:NAD(P)H-hydrate epimerase
MIRLSRQQVREVDRRAIEEYHIPGIVLMENASRAVAAAAQRMLRKTTGRKTLILCGGGNNGGDGLAAARHLHNLGFQAEIGLCTDPNAYKADALTNWQIIQAMKLPCAIATADLIRRTDADLIIDAIFGTGLKDAPRPPFEQIVAAIEQSQRPVLAVDLPSGMDCDTGEPLGACILAAHTVTFVAQKLGFANPHSRQFTGRITVAEIGCPIELIDAVRSAAPASGP